MTDVTKSVKVTFAKSLPMGTRGTFTHEGELWIAHPASKHKAIDAVLTRFLGIYNAITKDMISWINARPQDADLITMVLERVATARQLYSELAEEKTEATTS